MSPLTGLAVPLDVGFPRASGDEPVTYAAQEGAN